MAFGVTLSHCEMTGTVHVNQLTGDICSESLLDDYAGDVVAVVDTCGLVASCYHNCRKIRGLC